MTSTDKTDTSVLVDGLEPGTSYHFVIRTVTEPHANNRNQVISEPSAPVYDEAMLFPLFSKEMHSLEGVRADVMAQSEINIAIGDKAPEAYFAEIANQVNGGARRYGGIVDREILGGNLAENCLPACLADGQVPDYDEFLAERRRLMALRIKKWFGVLS